MAECLEMMGMTGKISNEAADRLRMRMDLIHLEMEAAEKRRLLAYQGNVGRR